MYVMICLIKIYRGQRNSPVPTRSVTVPPTIPERDYSGGQADTTGHGTSELGPGDQEREQNPPAAPS